MMQTVYKDTMYKINVWLMCILSLLMFTCWQVLETRKQVDILEGIVSETPEVKAPPLFGDYILLDEEACSKEAQEPIILTEKDNLDIYIDRVAKSYGLQPSLIRSVIQTESRWNPNAISADGGHVGLMQLSKRYQSKRAAHLGVEDLMDPYGNILVGTSYLADTLHETGDLAWALMIYNEGYKSAYKKHCAGIVSAYATQVMKGVSYA